MDNIPIEVLKIICSFNIHECIFCQYVFPVKHDVCSYHNKRCVSCLYFHKLESMSIFNPNVCIKCFCPKLYLFTLSLIVQLLYEMYGNDFICQGRRWYYKGKWGHWHHMEEGIFLRQKISEDIVNVLEDEKQQLENQIDCRKEVQVYSEIIVKLKSNCFKMYIMTECREVFKGKPW